MNPRLVTMTPEWASQLLRRNSKNRSIREYHVEAIASDIINGRWQLNPQTISVGSDGTLLDGQHRLMAIVRSQRPVKLLLIEDCPPECFATIDTGRSRTPGDVLKIEGAANGNHLAATIKLVILYENVPHLVWGGQETDRLAPKTVIVNRYSQDPGAWNDVIKRAQSVRRQVKLVNQTSIATFLYLYQSGGSACHTDLELSREYVELFASGQMLEPTNPVLLIRNLCISGSLSGDHRKAQTQLACHIKAFKYWKDGIPLKQFKRPAIPPMPTL